MEAALSPCDALHRRGHDIFAVCLERQEKVTPGEAPESEVGPPGQKKKLTAFGGIPTLVLRTSQQQGEAETGENEMCANRDFSPRRGLQSSFVVHTHAHTPQKRLHIVRVPLSSFSLPFYCGSRQKRRYLCAQAGFSRRNHLMPLIISM